MVAGRKALIQAGIDKVKNPEGYAALDVTRVGILIGTGMGGLTVFQDGELLKRRAKSKHGWAWVAALVPSQHAHIDKLLR